MATKNLPVTGKARIAVPKKKVAGIPNAQRTALLGSRAVGGGVTGRGSIMGSSIAGVTTPSITQNTGLQQMLVSQMNGTAGPSVAEAQFQKNTDQAMQGVASQIAAAGLNPGMQARVSARAGAQMQGQAAQDAAVLRAQEQAQSRSELGSLLQNQANFNLNGQMSNADNATRLAQEKIRGRFGNQQASTGAYGQVQSARVSSLPSLLSLGFGQTSPSNGYGSYG